MDKHLYKLAVQQLKEWGATGVSVRRTGKHAVISGSLEKTPFTFTSAISTSDHRGWKNELARMRRHLGIQHGTGGSQNAPRSGKRRRRSRSNLRRQSDRAILASGPVAALPEDRYYGPLREWQARLNAAGSGNGQETSGQHGDRLLPVPVPSDPVKEPLWQTIWRKLMCWLRRAGVR